MNQLLRRAWDALDAFKQAYPEYWNDEDQQVADDLLKADLDLSGIKREWVGLDFDMIEDCFPDGSSVFEDPYGDRQTSPRWLHDFAHALEAKLKEKNNG